MPIDRRQRNQMHCGSDTAGIIPRDLRNPILLRTEGSLAVDNNRTSHFKPCGSSPGPQPPGWLRWLATSRPAAGTIHCNSWVTALGAKRPSASVMRAVLHVETEEAVVFAERACFAQLRPSHGIENEQVAGRQRRQMACRVPVRLPKWRMDSTALRLCCWFRQMLLGSRSASETKEALRKPKGCGLRSPPGTRMVLQHRLQALWSAASRLHSIG